MKEIGKYLIQEHYHGDESKKNTERHDLMIPGLQEGVRIYGLLKNDIDNIYKVDIKYTHVAGSIVWCQSNDIVKYIIQLNPAIYSQNKHTIDNMFPNNYGTIEIIIKGEHSMKNLEEMINQIILF